VLEYWRGVDEVADSDATEAYDQFLEDEARKAVWHAWFDRVREEGGASSNNGLDFFTEVDGQLIAIPPLPPDAESAAAEELLRDGEPDVQGDEDGPVFVWKTDPLEALARVRPRLAASIRPVAITLNLARPVPRASAQIARAPRTHRRVARTASSRGDPDDPEPPWGRQPRPLGGLGETQR
jgi:hypothetical protein